MKKQSSSNHRFPYDYRTSLTCKQACANRKQIITKVIELNKNKKKIMLYPKYFCQRHKIKYFYYYI